MKNKSQSRLFVALLALALMAGACSGVTPTSPTVTTEPVVATVQPVSASRRFTDLTPGGGFGEFFTRTSGPAKVLIFANDEGLYTVSATIYVFEGGGYGAKLGEETMTFSGKQGQVDVEYDSSRCVYKSPSGEMQCIVSVRNVGSNTMASGTLRVDGVPLR